jgi:hypothetical protein
VPRPFIVLVSPAALLVLAAPIVAAAPAADEASPDACIARATSALKTENSPTVRLQRAACEEESGRLIDALADAREAFRVAGALHDAAAARAARTRLLGLAPRIPQVTLTPPPGIGDLTVTLDGQPVPQERLGVRFTVDPGPHAIHAEGTVEGVALAFDKDVDLKERDVAVVPITLTPVATRSDTTSAALKCVLAARSQEEAARCFAQRAQYLTEGQLECLLSAKNEQEVARCLPRKEGNLVAKVGSEISAYSDSTSVDVLSPLVTGSVSSPTAGWRVGGSYLVDVVSAASPDIVSEASPPFREVRQDGSVNGAYKRGLYGAEAFGNVSSEPDYLSLGAGLAFTADLADKLVTPRVGVDYSHDTIGRSTTPFSVFHHNLDVGTIEASGTFVMSATSVLLLSGTLQFERGDQSKVYRYVPMFDPATAARVLPGQSYASVNAARESIRPLEQLPLERNRYALGARFAHRFGSATLRLEERLYYDSWRQSATTTDLRFMVDLTHWLRLWPHLRLNAQNGANFYRLAYSPVVDPAHNLISVPTYRTGDRELSPLVTATGGGGLRMALTSPTSTTQLALTLQGDVMYSRYFQSLFITSRTALYGTLGLDAEFE